MPAPTQSPTVPDHPRILYSGVATPPTRLYSALLIEWLHSLSGETRPVSLDDAPFLAPGASPTGDSGAILLTLPTGNPYYSMTRLLSRVVASLGAQSESHMPLAPARIVDATIEQIRPPHLEALDWIRQTTGYSWGRVADLLGVSRQTLNRWQRNEPIKDLNRQRVFVVREVLERASARLKTRAALVAWLDTPRGSDGRTPAQCLAVGDIDRARLLAISSSSPGVSRPPLWVRRSIPEAFRRDAEHTQEAVPPEPDLDDPDE